MAPLKTKGDLAELKVAADLLERGYRIAIPFGEDNDFDLILIRGEALERVQVKYTESDGVVVYVRYRSSSLTNGRVRRVKRYTARTIEWMATCDATSRRCCYLPAAELGAGMDVMTLRLAPTRNGQRIGIRYAEDYLDPKPRRVSIGFD